MASWRGEAGSSGVLGLAVSAVIGIAAVVVAVVALSNAQRHEVLWAIGIAAVAVFVLAVIVFVMRKQIKLRQAKRYLSEERGIVADMKAALEEVRADLDRLPERNAVLDADMKAVNKLAARIKATSGINALAALVADEIYDGTFRPEAPEASEGTVIGALIRCDKAEDGFDEIENKLKSTSGRLPRVPRFAKR